MRRWIGTALFLLLGHGLLAQQMISGPRRGISSAANVTNVGNCVVNSSTATTNCSPGIVTAGDLILAVSKTANSSGTAVPTFSSLSGPACTWRDVLPTTQFGSGAAFNASMWSCIVPTTGAETVKVQWASGGGTFTDLSVSVWHSTKPWNDPVLDRATWSLNTTASTSCPTGTMSLPTQNPNDFVMAVCENFNQGEVWGAYTGWTNDASGSRNTTGVYTKTVSTAGTPTATLPMSTADSSQGFIAALQASNLVNCFNCGLVQSTDSAGQTSTYDHIALSGVVPGDTLVYMVYHNQWSGSGTTTMSDSTGVNIWRPCNVGTGGGLTTSMTDLGPLEVNFGMSCFYSIAVSVGGTVTGMPTASDCAGGCSFVGGWFGEFKGLLAWENFAYNTGTSTTGSNNVTCGTTNTTLAYDFIICSFDAASGTGTAGTAPLAATLFNTTNGLAEYGTYPYVGSITPTMTLSSSGIPYGAMTLVFR